VDSRPLADSEVLGRASRRERPAPSVAPVSAAAILLAAALGSRRVISAAVNSEVTAVDVSVGASDLQPA
jgi:hypothetical protein